MTWTRVVRALFVAVVCGLGSKPAMAECISVSHDNPVTRLRASEAVYLAQVESRGAAMNWPTAEVRVTRSWKGDAKRYTWAGANVSVGGYYLVYALPGWTSSDAECDSRPIPLEQAVPDIRVLDRHRGFPRLVVPKVKKAS
jgi:hypothetical protein